MLNEHKSLLIEARDKHMQDQESLINVTEELNQARNDLQAAKIEVNKLQNELELAQHDVVTRVQEMESMKQELASKQNMLDSTMETLAGTEGGDALAKLRDELKLAHEKIQTLQQQIQEFDQKQADAKKPSRKDEVKDGVVKIIEPYIKNVLMRNVVFTRGPEEMEHAMGKIWEDKGEKISGEELDFESFMDIYSPKVSEIMSNQRTYIQSRGKAACRGKYLPASIVTLP